MTTAGGLSLLLGVVAVQVWVRGGLAWMWLLGVGLIALVLLDGVASFLSLRVVEMGAVAPYDSMVDRADPLVVTLQRPHGRHLLRVTSVTGAPWVSVNGPTTGDLMVVPDRRGVFSAAEFELLSRAPLGLLAVARRVMVSLPEPVAVGPRPVAMPLSLDLSSRVDGERPGARTDDVPRGVREYVPGDSRRLVHWPVTARAGRLMVRDVAAAPAGEIRVVVDLGEIPGSAAEDAAGRAMYVAGALIERGYRVNLVTLEAGWVDAPVRTVSEAGRRLAAARCGPAPAIRTGDFRVEVGAR